MKIRIFNPLLSLMCALTALAVIVGCNTGGSHSPQPNTPAGQAEIRRCLEFTDCLSLILVTAEAKAAHAMLGSGSGVTLPPNIDQKIQVTSKNKNTGRVTLFYNNLDINLKDKPSCTIKGTVLVHVGIVGMHGLRLTVNDQNLTAKIHSPSHHGRPFRVSIPGITSTASTSGHQTITTVHTGQAAFKKGHRHYTLNISPAMVVKLNTQTQTPVIQSGTLNWLANKMPVNIVYKNGSIQVNGKDVDMDFPHDDDDGDDDSDDDEEGNGHEPNDDDDDDMGKPPVKM